MWLFSWHTDNYHYNSNIGSAKAHVKLVLLDEADAMTKDAQFALRRGIDEFFSSPLLCFSFTLIVDFSVCLFFMDLVIEKYTKSTRFALICNNVNKVIPALQSRCTRFRFAPLDSTHVTERLKHVIEGEG